MARLLRLRTRGMVSCLFVLPVLCDQARANQVLDPGGTNGGSYRGSQVNVQVRN